MRQCGFVGLVMIANSFVKSLTASSVTRDRKRPQGLDREETRAQYGLGECAQAGGGRIPAAIGRKRQKRIREFGSGWPLFFRMSMKDRLIATERGEGMRSEGWRAAGSVTTDDVVEQPRPFKGGA